MKLVELDLVAFSKKVDSNEPAPGGGSVAAYASNLGVALARMMGHLTVNKKAYLELTDAQRNEFEKTFNALEAKYNLLMDLVDEDTQSFNKVMDAFKMPKETDEEKALRSQAIQDGTLIAIECPLKAAKTAYEALEMIPALIEHGNKNAISDLASGLYLLQAGMNCSILNVKINVSGLKDKEKGQSFLNECALMQEKTNKIVEENMKIIEELL